MSKYGRSLSVQMIPLSQVNVSRFENPRGAINDIDVNGIFESIKISGLKQNVGGSRQADGTVGITDGFTRTEAMFWIALEPVFKEYNEKHGLTPDMPEYMHLSGRTPENCAADANVFVAPSNVRHEGRQRIRSAGKEWAEKYDAAVNSVTINVGLWEFKNEMEAYFHAVLENGQRTQVTLMSKLQQIERMTAENLKGKDIAIAMKLSNANVSQYKRVLEMFPKLEELFANLSLSDAFTKPEIIAMQARYSACISEIRNRMQVPEGDTKLSALAINFRHLREMSFCFFPANGSSLPAPQILNILAFLSRVDDSNHPTADPAPECSTFEGYLKSQVSIAKSEAEGTSVQTATEPTAGVSQGNNTDAATLATPTPAANTATTTQTTTTAATPAATASQPVQDGKTSTAIDMKSEENAALLQEIADVQVAVPASVSSATNAGSQVAAAASGGSGEAVVDMNSLIDSIGDIEEGDIEDSIAEEPGSNAGITRVKTQSAPEASAYQVMLPSDIHAISKEWEASSVCDDIDTAIQCLTTLSQAAMGYTVIGLGDDGQRVNMKLSIFVSDFTEWLSTAIDKLKTHAPAEVYNGLISGMPKLSKE